MRLVHAAKRLPLHGTVILEASAFTLLAQGIKLPPALEEAIIRGVPA